MRIALAGQPNCGKSTIFNSIAGYKAITSNFPGTTVKYTETKTHIEGYTCNCIDLPGTYSLTSGDPAELEARRHLLSGEVDVIINVIDASLLCRSLELTLQLLELEVPMILCLNMMDEAQRKGIQIDAPKLSNLLGVPVIPTIATTGKGLKELFIDVLRVREEKRIGKTPKFSKDIEEIVSQLDSILNSEWPVKEKVPTRFLSIKLLENDEFFINETKRNSNATNRIRPLQEKLEQIHGSPSDEVISSERHALAMNLFEKVSTVIHPPKRDIRITIDNWVMHKFFGYLILVGVFYGFFNFIFGIGGYIEEPLMELFDYWIGGLEEFFGKGSLALFLFRGVLQGIAGGIAIVLPYLVPFLIGLSILEDVGYLPRVAFLMDVFMHKIGLHGKSIIPFILGYGCSVPAVMATRILEFPQHRFIVSILTTMIPCAARITIIFGLVAFFISPNAALMIFALNILVVAVSGKILSTLYPEPGSLGLILEIPAYQLPPLKNTLKKSWYRIREFIVIAWPLLIIGSALLALMEYGKVDLYFNRFLSPLTHLLGLPVSVGATLIFGLLRKELSLIMLTQALGTTQVLTVMTKSQIMVFTVFVTFYIPCLATIAALWKEIGKKGALLAILFTLSVAIILALITHIFFGIFPLW
ncbi:MAG: ferrous iron transport protein B [Deltaproteobacteria bacterium CG03_land_8_20_14_0_80_45_14]|nr:MAG: ferrous iron transport protein B [Deltaproteobacteria bacterium CG03_land_8_20_14_0_80_45_14]